MIRREIASSSELPTWLLIPQAEHARLAGELADAWCDRLNPAELHAATRWAIYHHDDGWPDWERQPELDEQGRPIDFREMSHETANGIWIRSIEHAAAHGPLEAYLVARHFLDLRAASVRRAQAQQQREDAAGRPIESSRARPTPCPGAIEDCEFTQIYEEHAQEWRNAATLDGLSTLHTEQLAQATLRLQHFDWLSLLLCCEPSPRREPLPERLARHMTVELVPLSSWEFTLEPWPLRREELRLTVECPEVVARAYATPHELLAAATQRRLNWLLRRHEIATP